MAERSKEEQVFMEKVQSTTHNGVALRDLCIHGLRGMLGETPAQAVVYLMGEEAFEDPDLFVLRINEMLVWRSSDFPLSGRAR